MYSRDEIKALTDKVLEIAMSRTGLPDAKIDAAEVSFEGGERAATRWANSTITTNLVQYDWANLDAIGGPESWKMFGTGGDAKGQPTQTNSISHRSPTIRIKN